MFFCKKFPSFVLVDHSYLIYFSFKESIILSLILLKCGFKERTSFPYPISLVIKETGITRNTVRKSLDKLNVLKLINIIDEKEIFLGANIGVIEDEINDLINKEEKKRESSYYSMKRGHTNFNFELMRVLELNEVQYAILHSYFILSKKTGYANIGKGYFLYYFRIKERQFKYIKSKLLERGYIYRHSTYNGICVNHRIIKMFDKYIISDASYFENS